jgi:hypothetical protein
MNRSAAICCAVVLFAGFASFGQAQESTKKAFVTLSAPLEIPGTVLAPATYVFRVLDSANTRVLIQVWAEDFSKLHTTFIAIRDYRFAKQEKPIIVFDSQSPEVAFVGRAWCSPGSNFCLEFVYPRDRAAELAGNTHQTVLSMPQAMALNLGTAEIRMDTPSVQELALANVSAVGPAGDLLPLSDAVERH